MKRALWVAVGVLAACLVGYFLFFRPTDERRIQEKLDRLAKSASADGTETPVMRGTRISGEFAEIFAKEVVFEIPELKKVTSGREVLMALATQAGNRYQSLRLSFERVQIQLDNSKRTARVGATVTMVASRGAGDERDSRDVTLRFDKIDGDWKIASIVVSTKSPPSQ